MAENAAMTANTAQPDRIDGRDRGHRDGQAAGRTTGDLSTGVLTFLFTDIEGSTARWESQRAAMAAALARHDALLRAAIEGRGGQVFKTVGDAFCAVFADAAAALGAATDAQRALAAENWTAVGPDFDDLRVRMGLHTGQAEQRGGDYYGPALNRTARLMSAGHGGQVLLSLATQQLVRDYLPEGVDLRDLGEHRLKDLRHSEHLFQLLAAGLADIATAPVTAEALSARDRVVVTEGAATRPLPEALSGLLAAVRGEETTFALSPEQAREIAARRPVDLLEYRLGRIAEWSQPRYQLDGRFVALTLLVDQGEDAAGGRWAAKEARNEDLGALLAEVQDPAVVVLGPPGAGKSTLLRRLELDAAIEGLRRDGAEGVDGAGDGRDTVTFFIQLNQYKARAGLALADPGDWLATEWAERYTDLPPLEALLAEGRVILLLDALNEMPAAGDREYRERVGLWKQWLQRLTQTRPGNRVVFSCRTLDYSAPLSTPALRVPQLQIESLTDTQVEAFLKAYTPLRGAEIWAAIAGTAQLEALRAPYFLALLVEQVEATGDLAEDRAGIFTGFVRQALRREVERDNPLFTGVGGRDTEVGRHAGPMSPQSLPLLTSRDIRRVTQWQWKDGYELPQRGALFPKLGALAYGMQEAAADGGASQVRLDLDAALDLLDDAQGEDIVKAGLAIAVLDGDPAADELLYRHQLLQEYFAARVLAQRPKPELVASPWRAAEIRPNVPELLATLSPADTVPPLPQTGWEETTVLAAVMAEDKESFIRSLMPHNLAVAGRAAGLPAVRERLSTEFLDALRGTLLQRGRDPTADLRDRIAAADALADLGDPRWEPRSGPHGDYLLPPWVAVPGGEYPIGEDGPISWELRGAGGSTAAHVPAHRLALPPMRIGQYPVTHAEWACFLEGGGYDDERWWQTPDGQRWRRGELGNEGAKVNGRHWRARFKAEAGLFARYEAEDSFGSPEVLERWKAWLAMDDAAFERALTDHWRGSRQTEPASWRDRRFNRPTQPVVGVCWYEARAYCAWLAAQSGLPVRLPTEVEWEAAMRGTAGRLFGWGDRFEPLRANTMETRLRRTTPVGVFPEGEVAGGVADATGNIQEWTLSLWGPMDMENGEVPGFAYPYAAADGRERPDAPADVGRVVRGGSWVHGHGLSRLTCRLWNPPNGRFNHLGLRLLLPAASAGGTGGIDPA